MKPKIVKHQGRWHMWQGGSTWAENVAATNFCILMNRKAARERT